MLPPGPVRDCVPANREVKRELEELLDGSEVLRQAFRSMTHVLRINPEHSETEELPGEHRVFARKPKSDSGVPGLALLYSYNENEVVIWGVNVREVDE